LQGKPAALAAARPPVAGEAHVSCIKSEVLVRILLDDRGHLDLEVVGWDPDAVVNATLEIRGFSASASCHVLKEAWISFVDQVAQLEQTRNGKAKLESMSPDELYLEFKNTDRVGHMGIGGHLGYRGSAGEFVFKFSALGFDPTNLPEILRELRKQNS
jgi:hypothetical protein